MFSENVHQIVICRRKLAAKSINSICKIDLSNIKSSAYSRRPGYGQPMGRGCGEMPLALVSYSQYLYVRHNGVQKSPTLMRRGSCLLAMTKSYTKHNFYLLVLLYVWYVYGFVRCICNSYNSTVTGAVQKLFKLGLPFDILEQIHSALVYVLNSVGQICKELSYPYNILYVAHVLCVVNFIEQDWRLRLLEDFEVQRTYFLFSWNTIIIYQALNRITCNSVSIVDLEVQRQEYKTARRNIIVLRSHYADFPNNQLSKQFYCNVLFWVVAQIMVIFNQPSFSFNLRTLYYSVLFIAERDWMDFFISTFSTQ